MNGRLLLGLAVDGAVYFDFEVNLLTLAGECRAVAMLDELGLVGLPENMLSAEQMLLIEMVYLSQQLNIVGVPSEQLSAEFLLNHLTPTDYELVGQCLADLRKKRIAAGERLSEKPISP
ncbi:hypothetical protein [Lonepinella sp. BR2474]|uniref:hypothetical protein n=1 Tax=Lonepinella sp. BR2474 TaxID=3434548 RepID=UPI003F6E0760